MKILGVKQFHQKKFELLTLNDPAIMATLGSVTRNFIAVIYGYSGNGKTEFAMKLAKEFALINEKVAWLSYEQGHGYDLQRASVRNDMESVSGNFLAIDPAVGLKKGVTYFDDLCSFLAKRGSPDYIFIDSLDYLRLSFEEYSYLKNQYGNRKTFIFIAHADKKGNTKFRITERIIFDGGLGIRVDKYIAHVEKNRFGGFTPYIVWEEEAKIKNPTFFAKLKKDESRIRVEAGSEKAEGRSEKAGSKKAKGGSKKVEVKSEDYGDQETE